MSFVTAAINFWGEVWIFLSLPPLLRLCFCDVTLPYLQERCSFERSTITNRHTRPLIGRSAPSTDISAGYYSHNPGLIS